MEVSHLKGIDSSGKLIFAATFGREEGECCGDILACNHDSLDPATPSEEDFGFLVGIRYGGSNDEVPPRSLPETGGKCFISWVSDLATGWDEYTLDQQNLAFEIANLVYPDGNLYSELKSRI